MYWCMSLRSIHTKFQNIKHLGIYNPCMNNVYRIAIENISENVIREVAKDVICIRIRWFCIQSMSSRKHITQ